MAKHLLRLAAGMASMLALTAVKAQVPAAPDTKFKATPHSPTAAALGKYLDLPVTLATGTPQISIPLYEIKIGELTLPISLSYQATGFRVSERAGWVGLGWSLNAGGVLSRSIRDKKDDGSFERTWAPYQTRALEPSTNQADYAFLNQLGNLEARMQPDGQPDLFTFSFPGHSGRFIRPTISSIQLLPIQPLDIRAGGPAPGQTPNAAADRASWTIIDEHGQQFDFAAREVAARAHGRDVSSWFLTRMVSASKCDTLTLEYSAPYSYQMAVSESETVVLDPHTYALRGRTLSSSTPFDMQTRSLSKIRFKGGYVEFYASNSRRDVPGEVQLDSIRVFNRHHEVTKRVLLAYSNASTPTNRLKLLSVTECGTAASRESGQRAVHRFTYNATPLPAPTSMAQDHWGFYNGGSNGGLIPSFRSYIGANRAANGNAAQAQVLTRIDYPTGGYAAFEFEGHDHGTRLPQAIRAIPLASYAATWDPQQPEAAFQERQLTVPQDMRIVFDATVAQSTSHGSVISIRQGVPCIGSRLCNTAVLFTDLPQVLAYERDGPRAISSEPGGMNGRPVAYRDTLDLEPGTYTIRCVAYGPNTYNNGSQGSYANLNISYLESYGPRLFKQVGGIRVRTVTLHDGISHANDIVKSYRYRLQDSTVSSGLVAGTPNYYSNYISTYTAGDPGTLTNLGANFPAMPVYVTLLSASTQSNLGGGAHIFYERVEESIRGGNAGRSVYYYQGTGRGTGSMVFPNVPYDDYSESAPSLLKRVDFNAAGDTVHMIQNKYAILPALSRLLHGFGVATAPVPQGFTGVLSTEWTIRQVPYGSFIMLSEFKYLAETREYRYGTTAGMRPQLSINRSYYENPTHLQPTRSVELLGPADSLVTFTRYPSDLLPAVPPANADTELSALISLQTYHRLSTVVEQLRWRMGGTEVPLLLGGAFQSFTLHPVGTSNTMPALDVAFPSRIFSLVLSQPLAWGSFQLSSVSIQSLPASSSLSLTPQYQRYLSYDAYDRRGNPVQVRSLQDVPTAYLWGDGHQLMAEVRNATPGQVAYTSFEHGSPGRWKYPVVWPAHRLIPEGRTGRTSFLLGDGESIGLDSLAPLPANKKYELLFWSTGRPTIVLNGAVLPPTAATVVATAATATRTWQQYRVHFTSTTLASLFLTATTDMLLDEVRLHPEEAIMNSYTHEPLRGLTSQADASGRFTSFEYDAVGRLIGNRDERRRILTRQQYHFARP